MTAAHWRTIAFFCTVATFVLLVVSARKQTAWERDSASAVHVLDSVKVELADAQALARAGLTASLTKRKTIDSLWTIIRGLQSQPPPRQRTPWTVIDTADVHAVTVALVAITAERDTALADRDTARVQLAAVTATADALRLAALEHIRADSARLAGISASITMADDGVARARALAARPWWKRWAAASGRVAKAASIGAVGYAIGRLR